MLFRPEAVEPQDDVPARFLFEVLGVFGNVYQGNTCQRIGKPFARIEHKGFKSMTFPARKTTPLAFYG
jgi:hypothetical protein